MSEQTMNLLRDCLPMFEMLGDENRQIIASRLFEHGRLNVNELTELLHLSRPAVSHHMKLLLQAGLVQVAQEGKERYYSLDANLVLQRLQALTASLANDILNQQTQKGESS